MSDSIDSRRVMGVRRRRIIEGPTVETCTRRNLADTYRNNGDIKRAIEHDEHAVAIFESVETSPLQGASLAQSGEGPRASGRVAQGSVVEGEGAG